MNEDRPFPSTSDSKSLISPSEQAGPWALDTSQALADQASIWLKEAAAGKISWVEYAEKILQQSLKGNGDVMADRDRQRRCGFPEVIFGQSKTVASIINAGKRLLADADEVLVTRIAKDQVADVVKEFEFSFYHPVASTLRLAKRPIQQEVIADYSGKSSKATVAIAAAGTTDLPVALEASQTLAWMGIPSFMMIDCGVAGPYRLLARLEELRRADVLVVVAGMEGALASVAGGLVSAPVIAVPTSIGYGANLSGITTMLSMLTSCAAGVTTVNVDGGFKGGYVAGLICHRIDGRSS
jgi:NCAIR mutase (PurE)-related protein